MLKTMKPLITFKVDEVVPAGKMLAECRCYEALNERLGGKVESCCDYHGTVVKEVYYHGLLAAVYTAFSEHRPLVLSPDMIWITIMQGVAQHMTIHAEHLRERFVRHKGRLALTVDISHFLKGSPENPWEEAFAGWSGKIREHIGEELHEALVGGFSTTGPVEKTVNEIVLMDIFERYFHYVAVGICGIPEITLEGTVEDWTRLRERVEVLKRFDMEWWLDHLRGICDEFVRAARGQIHLEHWQGICKLRKAYGGDIINGWIAKLFPYLREFPGGPARRQNPIFETGEGFSSLFAPTGLSKVPFVWTIPHLGGKVDRYDMEVIGGFTGVEQEKETMALRPKIGWAVKEVESGEAALNRLVREHEVFPGIDIKDVTSTVVADMDDGFPSVLSMPEDMGRFYFRTNGAELFGKGKAARYRIGPVEKLTRSDSIANNECLVWCRFCDLADGSYVAIDLVQRNVLSREDRAKFAEFKKMWAGRIAAEDRRIQEELKQWVSRHPTGDKKQIREQDELLRIGSKVLQDYRMADHGWRFQNRHAVWLVVHCRPEMVRREMEMPVIAESFGEFLRRALNSGGKYWWEEAGFEVYGTVGEYMKRS
jgi:hypothetical protein